MPKGDKSKAQIAKALKEAFGDKYKGEYNKAYYINLSEDGELCQIKVALTKVKAPIEFDETTSPTSTDAFDWGEPTTNKPASAQPATEITQEEIDNVKNMLARLGL